MFNRVIMSAGINDFKSFLDEFIPLAMLLQMHVLYAVLHRNIGIDGIYLLFKPLLFLLVFMISNAILYK